MTGKEEKGPRNEFYYVSDDGLCTGVRYQDWKVVFSEQRAHGIEVWMDPYFHLRAPWIYNLRRDPFERVQHESIGYYEWYVDHMFVFLPAISEVGKFLQTFKEFPPRQRPDVWNLEEVMKKFMPTD